MASPLQLSIVNFNRNSYIIVEGKQKADYFYIIRSGKVRISKEVEVVEEEGGNILAPGDFFGVISTMSSHSHIETALALTDVSLISVHREQYGLLIERNAPVAMKIIQSFSRKMRFLDEALTRLTFKNTASGDPSHLFKVAEYYARQSQYNQAYYAYYRFLQNCPTDPNADKAKERMAKIHPYAKAVYLDKTSDDFTRTYPKNTMIFSENEPGTELYIIQKGVVKITKIVEDNEVLLAMLKTGDIFGEMALLENKPRSASAIANEDCSLMAVNKANFERMVQTQPQLITRLTTAPRRTAVVHLQAARQHADPGPPGQALRRAAPAAGEEPHPRGCGREVHVPARPQGAAQHGGPVQRQGQPVSSASSSRTRRWSSRTTRSPPRTWRRSRNSPSTTARWRRSSAPAARPPRTQ